VRFTDLPSLVEAKTNRDVMVAAAHQIGVENNQLAVRLRDEGNIEEARQTLYSNTIILSEQAARYRSSELDDYAASNRKDALFLDADEWIGQRKSMRATQYRIQNQQAQR
jgi:phosphoglycolate phosphatase-like HAD superfamily hydrolase